jgi:hypothetical protein
VVEDCARGRGLRPWPRTAPVVEDCARGRGLRPWSRTAPVVEDCADGRARRSSRITPTVTYNAYSSSFKCTPVVEDRCT